MIKNANKSLAIHKKAEKALREAVRKVVAQHKKTGIPLAIWKDGKVANVQAKDLRVTGR